MYVTFAPDKTTDPIEVIIASSTRGQIGELKVDPSSTKLDKIGGCGEDADPFSAFSHIF